IAQATSDWPRRASPAAKTPSTVVANDGALTFPRAPSATPSSATAPPCSGWAKPIATRTRSAPSTDLDPAAEAHALGGEPLDAAIDDPLVELAIGDAEAQQPAGRLVALVDRDPVTAAIELRGGSQPGGPGADHGDAAPGTAGGR